MQIQLLSHWGDDKMVANVARVSYGKEVEKFEEKDVKLINYLVKHGHTSPFRHPKLQFRVKCAIYVERQLFKHSVGVDTNSISGRYVDFSDTYYKIEQFRLQSKDSKQGSGEDLNLHNNLKALRIQDQIIRIAEQAYKELLAMNVSKEQARSILPLSLETEFIWTGSFQAFIYMCNLRLKPDAQRETQDVVRLMLEEVQKLDNNPFANSLKAFGY